MERPFGTVVTIESLILPLKTRQNVSLNDVAKEFNAAAGMSTTVRGWRESEEADKICLSKSTFVSSGMKLALATQLINRRCCCECRFIIYYCVVVVFVVAVIVIAASCRCWRLLQPTRVTPIIAHNPPQLFRTSSVVLYLYFVFLHI
jgi:hypothetical protein